MLDLAYIRAHTDEVQKGADDKKIPCNIRDLVDLADRVKAAHQKRDALLAARRSISEGMPHAKEEEKAEIRKKVKDIKAELDLLLPPLEKEEKELQEKLLWVPQPAAEDVPVGLDDKDNVEEFRWGLLPQETETPRDHVSMGEKWGWIDAPRGVKLSGSRSFVLKGGGALLEQALLRWGYDLGVQKGFTPFSVPLLVQHHVMEGTGYFPVGKEQAYCIEKDELSLIGTGEVPLCGYHSGEVLEEDQLPLRYMTLTPCFRREAGTYGKDTRGLFRVHQFYKIEMVILAPQGKDLSRALHEELLKNAEDILQSLELPYRRVYVCTGDLGQGQVRKHDLEVWIPSRGGYGETHSCSTFHDFQTRRLHIKYRSSSGEKLFAYSLNNTLLAAPRLLAAIMENYQTPEGNVRVPKVLKPYLGGRELLGEG